MHGRDEHERYGREILRRQAGLIRKNPALGHFHVLRVAAPAECASWKIARRLILGISIPLGRIGREARRNDDAITLVECLGTWPQLLDAADNVGADDVRQRYWRADGPGSDQRVVVVRADRINSDEHVAGSWSGCRNLGEEQDVDITEPC